MRKRELSLLDLGLFSREMLMKDYERAYSNCIIVVNKNNYLEKLINDAKTSGCYIHCTGNIFRLIVDNVASIEYWSSSNTIIIYGFRIRVLDKQKINNMILLVVEGGMESYVSGICDGKHFESYVGKGDIVILMLRYYNEKLFWECIS